jgi:hypothetical protein
MSSSLPDCREVLDMLAERIGQDQDASAFAASLDFAGGNQFVYLGSAKPADCGRVFDRESNGVHRCLSFVNVHHWTR